MKELTVSDVMAFEPCYSKERVEELFNGRDSLSLLDILNLDIPTKDKVWVLTRPGVLPDAILKEFAALTANRAVRQNCLTCGLPTVEAWAVKWLDGSDRSADAAEAARKAACGAAYEAVRDAAWAAQAAYWAAREAARVTAQVAYWAAQAAYWAAQAAYGAAEAAERQQQVADLRRLISA